MEWRYTNRGACGEISAPFHLLAEVVVHGSEKAEFILNGKAFNIIHNMKFQDADGEWKPLGKGNISIQAEWAGLEYRTIRVKEIVWQEPKL